MKKPYLLLLLASLIAVPAAAGGFQLNLQGQKQTGMGHTGTGFAMDNAVLFFNPGGMSFLDSLQGIYAGASFIMPRTTYRELFPGVYTEHIEKHAGTPVTIYAVFKFRKNAKWNAGIGIYNPFGSRLEWPGNWKGQFLVREIDLKTFYIQPTVSYKINSKLGIGAGFIYATGDFSLRKGIPLQDTAGNYGEASLAGKASGYGFNAGIYFRPNEKWSVGIDYRSQVNVKVTGGTADFTVPSSLSPLFPDTKFTTGLNLPSTLTLGAGYSATAKLKLTLDINYVGWSSYDSLIIRFQDHTDQLQDQHSAKLYQNSFIFRGGAQYQANEKWQLRLGAYYDISPVKAGYVSPETPDENKLGITTGFSFRMTKRIHIDGSLLYIEGFSRTDTNLETGFGGTYKSKAVVPGVGVEISF